MTCEEGKGIIEALDCSKLSAKLFLLAVKSLDKQVPKVPDIYGDGYADGEMVYDMWKCPNCGKSYELDHDIYDYCPCCGQAIDWTGIIGK